MKAWVNSEYINWEDAKVPILSHGFSRGSAIFEVVDIVAAEKGPAFFGLQAHMNRFFNSATYMYMTLPLSPEEMIQACVDTARENKVTYGAAKFFAYYSAVELDVIPHDKKIDVAIFCVDFGKPEAGKPLLPDPVNICVSSYRKSHPESVPIHAKATGNYVGGYLAKMEAKEQGFDDVVFLDTMGFVAEAATANIFFVKDNRIQTPTLRSVLPGINRMALLDILSDLPYDVKEMDLRPNDLYACDEAFFTSSVVKVMPIKSIDGISLGNECPGPVTQKIAEKVSDVFGGKLKQFEHWLTYI